MFVAEVPEVLNETLMWTAANYICSQGGQNIIFNILGATVCCPHKLSADGANLPAETVQGDEYTCIKQALISPELQTEWKTFHRYLSQQPKETLNSQL